jgi:hypothetical protein
MPNMLTKIVKKKRVMRSLRDSYCLQKSTPDQWFLDYSFFLENLFKEMGFQCENASNLFKPRGQKWWKCLTFSHTSGGGPVVELRMERERKQEGGEIHVSLQRGLDVKPEPNMCFVFNTLSFYTSPHNPSCTYEVQSKHDLGDKLISLIRDQWQNFNPPPPKSPC